MNAVLQSGVGTATGSGHPLWHFAAVLIGPLVTSAALGLFGRWKRTRAARARIEPFNLVLAGLGLTAAAIHVSVCAEHFREWIVYGLFFVAASVFQASWSVAILVRPSRRLLLLGALVNDFIVILFVASRTIGMPFGPEARQPEPVTAAGLAATICELALVAAACYRLTDRGVSSNRRSAVVRMPGPMPHVSHPVFELILWNPSSSVTVPVGGVASRAGRLGSAAAASAPQQRDPQQEDRRQAE